MNVVLDVLAIVGFMWLLILIHEYGHLWAGRMLGVPADRIRVEFRPPHVALLGENGWVPPDDESYAEVFMRWHASAGGSWLYIAAGLLVETAVALAGAVVLAVVDLTPVAVTLLTASLILAALYLLYDVVGTVRTGRPAGDHSAMWSLTPTGTALLIIVSFGVKVCALVLL